MLPSHLNFPLPISRILESQNHQVDGLIFCALSFTLLLTFRMSIDVGLSHIALTVSDVQKSIAFYAKYAKMEVVHSRTDAESGRTVVWLSDRTRPFAVVLMQSPTVGAVLMPFAHLGVGCKTREDIDLLCAQAKEEGVLIQEPKDSGYPIGYWAFLRDPDGHTLELAHGQEIGLTIEHAHDKDVPPPPKPTEI